LESNVAYFEAIMPETSHQALISSPQLPEFRQRITLFQENEADRDRVFSLLHHLSGGQQGKRDNSGRCAPVLG
jgi:hypothetical protein